ncbi:unnamed protein product [Meloidogyne enterolobii]|uniref:Uncharacterized protein n=1 Tax=Meloidogyne enterolobii TaxID=390850 RepID=A0ACB0YPX4_MELEN
MSTLTQQRSRKLTLAYQIANGVENIRTEPSSSPHFAFVDVLEKYFRICNTKPIKQGDIPFEFKLYHNFIERSVLSCIIEIKYFVVPKSRTSDGQMVCMQKMLWLINNGVDLSKQSRFEVYQKITSSANMMVSTATNSLPIPLSNKMYSILFGQLSRLVIIDQKCMRCGKRLRDFTPVVLHRNPSHNSCK